MDVVVRTVREALIAELGMWCDRANDAGLVELGRDIEDRIHVLLRDRHGEECANLSPSLASIPAAPVPG